MTNDRGSSYGYAFPWLSGYRHLANPLVTKPSGNDNAHFEALLGLENSSGDDLFLFDCGYFNIERYHQITQGGTHFVTKLHRNIKPEAAAERPLPARPGKARQGPARPGKARQGPATRCAPTSTSGLAEKIKVGIASWACASRRARSLSGGCDGIHLTNS